MNLVVLLFLRFHPDVINVVKEGSFMESFTLLDGDRVHFRGAGKDLFVAIQPHHIMGSVYSTVGEDVILHNPRDRFRVRDQDLVLNYSYRGGAVVNAWQIPNDMCLNHNVFSTQQREAVIKVQNSFDTPTKVCWFLNFRKSVEFSLDFMKGPLNSSVQIGDTSNLAPGAKLLSVDPKGKLTGLLGKQQLIVLDTQPGEVDLSVHLASAIPFADWTDSPSLFQDRSAKDSNDISDLPLYLVTIRDVKLWIWGTLFGIVAFILLFTATILFFRPLRKLGLAGSDINALTKAALVKAKAD
jgi:hypothetical protein